jgi:acyl dehydratase
MAEKEKRADLYKTGEEFEPLEYRVTPEWNAQFQEALEAYYPRYEEETAFGPPLVVPGLFIVNSNVTRSPGFKLDPGMAAVHAKEEVEFINPGRVGKRFEVTWKVVDYYEKRDRPFQTKEALIVDEDGVKILCRRLTDTYMGGPYKGAKGGESPGERREEPRTHLQSGREEEKESGDRGSITRNAREGSEFAGRLRTVFLERINFFSGGYPKGPNWPAKNIHTDLETAKRCGLETVAASGAMFEGYLADLMTDLFGVEWLNYGMMTLAFINVVNKDDTLVPKGVVRSKEVAGSKLEFTLDLWCENQYGTKVVVGTGRGFLK